MKIDHVAVFVRDMEQMKTFYQTYFNAQVLEDYWEKKGRYRICRLGFGPGARLELFYQNGLENGGETAFWRSGFTHISFAVENSGKVNRLVTALSQDGFEVVDGPRNFSVPGGTQYECWVLDPESNVVEIAAPLAAEESRRTANAAGKAPFFRETRTET